MQINEDYYKILGVSKNATHDEISKAYKKLALKFHPDRQTNKSEQEKKQAEEQFKRISEAYDTLGNENKRNAYDNADNMTNQFGNEFASDMFSTFAQHFNGFGFSGMHNFSKAPKYDPSAPEDGADIQIQLQVTFKESLFGVIKEFDVDVEEECIACHGFGTADGKSPTKCPYCHGSGIYTQQHGPMIVQSACPNCNGHGYINTIPCPKCHGSKRTKKNKHIQLKIPAGVATGIKLRIAGAGQAGLKGGNAGDCYAVLIVEKSDIFVRNGYDLTTTLYISPIIATIGGEANVYTPYGSVKIKIPAGTNTGKTFKLANKGIKTSTRTGDLYLNVEIEPLVNLSKDQIELLTKFNKTLTDKNLKKTYERQVQLKKLFN